MVLLRLRTDEGAEGAGRGGAAVASRRPALAEVARGAAEAGGPPGRARPRPAAEDPLAFAVATILELCAPRRAASRWLPRPRVRAVRPRAKARRRAALGDAARRPEAEPVHCNATLTAGRSATSCAGRARAWAADGFRHLQAEARRRRRRRRDGRRGARGPRAGRPDPRRRERGLGGRGGDRGPGRDLEQLDIELAEQPVAGLREMARVAREVAIPLAADEAVSDEADAHRAVQRRACEFATAKLVQGRRDRRRARRSRPSSPPISRARSTARLASPRRPTRPRSCAAAATTPASPTGSRRSGSSPTRWPSANASFDDGPAPPARGSGPRRRDRRGGARSAIGSEPG